MRTKTTFLKEAKKMVQAKLVHIGFDKWRYIFRKELEDGFIGDIGLNAATTRGYPDWDVNPVIGVYSRELGRLLSELHERQDPYETSQISIPLGYLTPEHRYREWHFEEGFDNEAVADNMVATIEAYGVPWMEANCSLEVMCETMLTGKFGWTHWLEFCTPVGLYLLNRNEEAIALARQNLVKRSGTGGDYETDYRKFVKRLEAKLAETE